MMAAVKAKQRQRKNSNDFNDAAAAAQALAALSGDFAPPPTKKKSCCGGSGGSGGAATGARATTTTVQHHHQPAAASCVGVDEPTSTSGVERGRDQHFDAELEGIAATVAAAVGAPLAGEDRAHVIDEEEGCDESAWKNVEFS